MRVMGLEAIYPKPRLSVAGRGHRIYPYLLRDVAIERPHQVWSADITYVPMPQGFMYLAAVIDWFSRYVLLWRLSNTLDGSFCLETLEEALGEAPRGVQYRPRGAVHGRGVDGPMGVGGRGGQHGRSRSMHGQLFVERLWRTVKYEDVYVRGDQVVPELQRGLDRYFTFYNEERPHQSLEGRTPWEVYRG